MIRYKINKYLSILLAALLLNTSAVLAQKVVKSSAKQAGFSFSTDSTVVEPIIHFQQEVQMLSASSDHQTVSIFGDGRVLVHNPVYMKKAGDYELWLSDKELEDLIQVLSNNGMMNFDEKKVKDKVRADKKALRAQGQLFGISDDVHTIVTIKFDEYQKNSRASKQVNFHKQIKWKNLEHDAKHFRKNSALVKANDSIVVLRKLKNDVRLGRKVPR